jgi:hypothetical protein
LRPSGGGCLNNKRLPQISFSSSEKKKRKKRKMRKEKEKETKKKLTFENAV